nr:uncharacterized mitochondrial protein AtMg00810-like [Tanacetum cinerariifolium]
MHSSIERKMEHRKLWIPKIYWVPCCCDLLALVDGFTLIEDNASLLETRFNEESVCVFVFPEDVMGLVNLTLLSLFFGVTATNFSLELLMLGIKRLHDDLRVTAAQNKPDLDTMSFDDLYNNFKIIKQEAKGTASSSSSLSSQNIAFVSSPSSTNEVNTTYGVSTANTQVSPASTQVSTASTQTSNSVSKDISNEVKESHDTPLVKELVSDDKLEKKTVIPTIAKIEFVRPKQQEKPVKLTVITIEEKGWYLGINIQGPVNTTHPKTAVYSARPMSHFSISAQSTAHDWKMSYLSEYEEIDGGYVAFRGDPKGGKITSKSKISIDTECVVLSPDFKLLDESQVLLRVPRKNNMYSVDLKNVAPSGDPLNKFNGKADEGFFVGYSMNRKAFRVFNSRTRIVEDTLHITFIENKPNVAGSRPTWIFDIDTLTKSMNYKPVVAGNQSNGSAGKAIVETVSDKDYILLPLWTQDPLFLSSSKDSPSDGFKPSGDEEKKDAGDPRNEDNRVLNTKEPRVNQEKEANVNITNSINTVSPSDNVAGIKDNVVDENIVYGCADDPNMPNLKHIVYLDKDDDVELKKVIQALTYPSWIKAMQDELLQFKLQQKDDRGILVRNKEMLVTRGYTQENGMDYDEMNVKSAFLYGKIKEEVYACQPSGFEDPEFPDRVYKVEKIASTPMDTSKPLLKDENAEDVDVYLYRSMIGSLMYLTSSRPDIMFFVCECARFQVTPKVSHLHAVKRIFRYLKGQPKLGLWYPKDSPFELEAYTKNDYAGASLDRKSTTRGCQFLRRRLISLQCKKQTIVANCTTNVKYVAASNCYGQATAKVNTVNEEEQIQALVDKKKVIITETSVRILLWPLLSSVSPQTKEFNFSKYSFDNMVKNLEGGVKFLLFPKFVQGHTLIPNYDSASTRRIDTQHPPTIIQPTTSQPQRKQKPRKARRKDTDLTQTSVLTKVIADEVVYEEMYDSVERAATTATGLDAEQNKGIISKTQFMATLNEPSSIGTSSCSRPRRQETIGDAAAQTSLKRKVKKLEKKASKRTHKLNRLYKIGVTLVDETQGRNDQDMFDTGVLDNEEVVAEKEVSTADPVTTACEVVNTVDVKFSAATTPTIFMDDIILAKALAALKSAKPMVKKPSVPVSVAKEEERLARQKEEAANIALITKWDDVQAMIDADHELAKRLQAEEQGELTIEERLKLFVELMNERKKNFVRLRAEEKRRKPPTKLKRGIKYKEVIEGSETRVKGSSKREREELKSNKSKRQKLDEKVEAKVDDDQEEAEMKMYMKLVHDDEVAIDAIPLATKPPIIVD